MFNFVKKYFFRRRKIKKLRKTAYLMLNSKIRLGIAMTVSFIGNELGMGGLRDTWNVDFADRVKDYIDNKVTLPETCKEFKRLGFTWKQIDSILKGADSIKAHEEFFYGNV